MGANYKQLFICLGVNDNTLTIWLTCSTRSRCLLFLDRFTDLKPEKLMGFILIPLQNFAVNLFRNFFPHTMHVRLSLLGRIFLCLHILPHIHCTPLHLWVFVLNSYLPPAKCCRIVTLFTNIILHESRTNLNPRFYTQFFFICQEFPEKNKVSSSRSRTLYISFLC